METDLVLGQTERTIRISTQEEANLAIISLIAQARRKIVVFSPSLDGGLFNILQTSQTLARFVVRHPRNRARFVIEDSGAFLHENARIVELCRRFSSFVQARQVGEEHLGLSEMFLVADDVGYLHQRHMERREFLINFKAPGPAGKLARRFQEIWEQSTPIPGLHTLGL